MGSPTEIHVIKTIKYPVFKIPEWLNLHSSRLLSHWSRWSRWSGLDPIRIVRSLRLLWEWSGRARLWRLRAWVYRSSLVPLDRGGGRLLVHVFRGLWMLRRVGVALRSSGKREGSSRGG